MNVQERHVTDRKLLHGLDDELSKRHRIAVDCHLVECEICRGRRDAIESVVSAASSVYRESPPSASISHEHSRARLAANLKLEAEKSDRSLGWLGGLLNARRGLAGVAAVAAVAMVGWLSIRTAPEAARVNVVSVLGVLPVSSVTPGATWDITTGELCSGTRHTRTINAAMRHDVLAAYGVNAVPEDQYELDYLITPELGGATDARNLWPQGYASPVWNARVKDELERLLPQLVCSRQLDLATAQRDMAVDWIAAYKKYFRTDLPLEAHRGPAVDDDESGVYLLADAGPAPAIRLVSLAIMR